VCSVPTEKYLPILGSRWHLGPPGLCPPSSTGCDAIGLSDFSVGFRFRSIVLKIFIRFIFSLQSTQSIWHRTPTQKINLVFIFLPFVRIGSAVSSSVIGQKHCAFGQIICRLTKHALQWCGGVGHRTCNRKIISSNPVSDAAVQQGNLFTTHCLGSESSAWWSWAGLSRDAETFLDNHPLCCINVRHIWLISKIWANFNNVLHLVKCAVQHLVKISDSCRWATAIMYKCGKDYRMWTATILARTIRTRFGATRGFKPVCKLLWAYSSAVTRWNVKHKSTLPSSDWGWGLFVSQCSNEEKVWKVALTCTPDPNWSTSVNNGR